jgi:hypothetical protein
MSFTTSELVSKIVERFIPGANPNEAMFGFKLHENSSNKVKFLNIYFNFDVHCDKLFQEYDFLS